MNAKVTRLISAVLLSALFLPLIPVGAPASAASEPSSWAIPEINEANTEGILTPNAQKDFQRNLTRAEFCELVVALIERTLGTELPLPSANPFTDTSNIDVQKASVYGGTNPVVNGVGEGLFAPDKSVARQEIIAMMIRALNRLSTDTGKTLLPAQPPASLPFNDNSKIHDYAVTPIKLAYANGMIKGDNLGNFNPLAQIKSEECVAIVRRSNNSTQSILNTGLTNEQLADKTIRDMNIGFAYGDTADGVSQDVLLPTAGAGGAVITWSSGNPGVVSAAGDVSTAGAPATAALTATVSIGSVTRTRQFTLKTTSASGDDRILDNAYRELEISFLNAGDTLASVTGRVFLPDSVLGAGVKWSSNLPSVVNATTGAVTVPSSGYQSVTLTAVVTYNGKSVTKTFALSVMDSRSAKPVALHGVELGMTLSQVQSVLGAARDSFRLSTAETWYVFHTNYGNFIAVDIRSSGVAAIYSMASGWASQLKDKTTGAVITPEQADAMAGVGGKAYTDSSVSGGSRYAVLIYDEASGVTASRALDQSATEQFIFQAMNAFRYLNSRSALVWNAKLGASARAHTVEMGQYNYLSETGRNNSSFASRAQAQGYESALVASGAVTGGGVNAFDILDGYIVAAGARAKLLNTSLTVVGVGFGSGYTGANSTLSAVAFGTLIGIAGVTSTPSVVAVNVGASAVVALSVAPTNYNEKFTVTSSNTAYMTAVSSSVTATSITVTGIAQGTANITVTGSSSGNVYSIPVSVGTVYASSITIVNESGAAVASNSQTSVSNAGNYVLGRGNTYQFTATTNTSTSYASSAAVTWSSSNTAVATVSSTGLVTGVNNGSAAITAKIQRSASTSDYVTVTMSFTVVTLSFKNGSATVSGSIPLDISNTTAASVTVTPSVTSLPSGAALIYSGVSSSPAIAAVTSSPAATVSVAGRSSGTATITVTASISGGSIYNYYAKVSGSFTVTVTGQSLYPTGAAFSDATGAALQSNTLDVFIGETKTIIVTPTPANAANKIVSYFYSGGDITVGIDANKNITVTGGTVSTSGVKFEIRIQTDASGSVKPYEITVNVNPVNYGITTSPANGAQISMVAGDSPSTFTATITPDYAPKDGLSVTWTVTSDSTNVVTLSATTGNSITVTAVNAGTAYVSAEVTGYGVNTAKSTITITVVGAVPA
ncbi:MAG: Ig-like domain-containing protein [Oscillospiraceae bacterium]|jgi:uncharacterized protein YkwD|nr:Ig-like domain-containing protein [Oscillospiraceae bacterium]